MKNIPFIQGLVPVMLAGTFALSLLGMAFVTLKLCNVIEWPWWWVIVPFLIPTVLFMASVMIAVVYMFGAGTITLLDKFKK